MKKSKNIKISDLLDNQYDIIDWSKYNFDTSKDIDFDFLKDIKFEKINTDFKFLKKTFKNWEVQYRG